LTIEEILSGKSPEMPEQIQAQKQAEKTIIDSQNELDF